MSVFTEAPGVGIVVGDVEIAIVTKSGIGKQGRGEKVFVFGNFESGSNLLSFERDDSGTA